MGQPSQLQVQVPKRIEKSEQSTVRTHLFLETLQCCSVSEIRPCCLLPAAVIPKSNRWISQYKFPQLLYLIYSNIISYGLLGSNAVYQIPRHYISQDHKLNTGHPDNFNPQSPAVFALQDISQWESLVCRSLLSTPTVIELHQLF